jgi:hypothetical protein
MPVLQNPYGFCGPAYTLGFVGDRMGVAFASLLDWLAPVRVIFGFALLLAQGYDYYRRSQGLYQDLDRS